MITGLHGALSQNMMTGFQNLPLAKKDICIIFNKMNMMDENQLEPYQKNSLLLRALSHPVRLAILDILRQDEACVCHMEAVLHQRQAYISQQLTVLKQAGVIEDHRDGWNVFYRICDPKIFDLIDLSRKYAMDGSSLPEVSLKPQNCPCPKCNPEKTNKKNEGENHA